MGRSWCQNFIPTSASRRSTATIYTSLPQINIDDYITTLQPGIKFANMDKVSGVDFDYNLGAVFYGKESDRDYHKP